jgi:hypothetical protein
MLSYQFGNQLNDYQLRWDEIDSSGSGTGLKRFGWDGRKVLDDSQRAVPGQLFVVSSVSDRYNQ